MALDTADQPTTGTDALLALVDRLTLEEKVQLLVGADLWTTTAIPRIGLRAMVLSDGPAGVRGVGPDAGTSASFPARAVTITISGSACAARRANAPSVRVSVLMQVVSRPWRPANRIRETVRKRPTPPVAVPTPSPARPPAARGASRE